MKKWISMLTVLALLLCACAALAEGGNADDPEGEAYVGLWAVDDYILEILPADTDARLEAIGAVRIDAGLIARAAGSPKSTNVVLVGALSTALPFSVEEWQDAIRRRVPPKTVEANLKACAAPHEAAGEAYNVAYGGREYLIDIYYGLTKALGVDIEPLFGPDRAGDIKHSNANIEKARRLLGYDPDWSFDRGIAAAIDWYREHLA